MVFVKQANASLSFNIFINKYLYSLYNYKIGFKDRNERLKVLLK